MSARPTIQGRATLSDMGDASEPGLAHVLPDFGNVHGGLDSPEFAAMDPHRPVPVLRDVAFRCPADPAAG